MDYSVKIPLKYFIVGVLTVGVLFSIICLENKIDSLKEENKELRVNMIEMLKKEINDGDN